MVLYYYCCYCGVKVGSFEFFLVLIDLFGFQYLINEERNDMIFYKENGDVYVLMICEDC